MDLSRAQPTSLPGAISNPNAMRPQANTNISPSSALPSAVSAQPAQLTKTAKKPRKDGEPERDVQSPAYSDISDDSPAIDSDSAGMYK